MLAMEATRPYSHLCRNWDFARLRRPALLEMAHPRSKGLLPFSIHRGLTNQQCTLSQIHRRSCATSDHSRARNEFLV
jgi:hypothetical protein